MKPEEYYSFPQQRKQAWWLPLALVLILVFIGAPLRSCGGEPAETAASSAWFPGVKTESFHTVLLDGSLYNVLDGDYPGEYDLQTLVLPKGTGPEDFRLEAVLDRAEYEAFCKKWGLTPAFSESDRRFAVVARAADAGRVEVQLGGVSVSGSTAAAVLRDRFSGESSDAVGFLLTIPVSGSVTELKTEALYTPEEIDRIRAGEDPARP